MFIKEVSSHREICTVVFPSPFQSNVLITVCACVCVQLIHFAFDLKGFPYSCCTFRRYQKYTLPPFYLFFHIINTKRSYLVWENSMSPVWTYSFLLNSWMLQVLAAGRSAGACAQPSQTLSFWNWSACLLILNTLTSARARSSHTGSTWPKLVSR